MPVRLRKVIGLVDAHVHAAVRQLVQMRLPEVRARALDQRYVRLVAPSQRVAELRRELEAARTAADDDDAKFQDVVLFFFAGGRSVHTPSNTSAAMPIDSDSVGCG